MKKMKVLLGASLGLALSLSISSTAFAEDNVSVNANVNASVSTGTTTPGGVREVIKGVRDALKEKNETMRAEIKTNNESARVEIKKIREDQKDSRRKDVENRLEKHIQNISKRFSNAIENLIKIDARIDARITLLKQAGKSTSVAEALSADAKVNIQAAKDGIAKLPSLKVDGFTAEKLQSGLASFRAAITAIENNLKVAKSDLVNAIGLIKGLGPIVTPSVSGSVNATTTATTSVSH